MLTFVTGLGSRMRLAGFSMIVKPRLDFGGQTVHLDTIVLSTVLIVEEACLNVRSQKKLVWRESTAVAIGDSLSSSNFFPNT
jgi:hypothetical protein